MCEGCAPPLIPNVFIFMQFSGQIGQIIGCHPLLGLALLPPGNPGSATVRYGTYTLWLRGVLISEKKTFSFRLSLKRYENA